MNTLVSIFSALSDRNRLRIIASLMDHEELCACQITELLGVTGATASRHLGVLVAAGLIANRKEGRWIFYRLSVIKEFEAVMECIKNQFKKSKDIKNDLNRLKKIIACDPETLCRRQRGVECCPN